MSTRRSEIHAEEAVVYLRRALLKLQEIWEDVGILEDQRVERTHIVSKHIKGLLDQMIEEEDEMKTRLAENIKLFQLEINSLCTQLKLPPFEADRGGTMLQLEKATRTCVEDLRRQKGARMEGLVALVAKDRELCDRMSASLYVISHDDIPSQEQLQDYRSYLDDLAKEKDRRHEEFLSMKKQVLSCMADLELVAETSFEKQVLCEDEGQFCLSTNNLDRLKLHLSQMEMAKLENDQHCCAVREKIQDLWERLKIPQEERDAMSDNMVNSKKRNRAALEEELQRLDELKLKSMKAFTETIRAEVVLLWDKCLYSQEQREAFTPYYSVDFTEELLSLHEQEVVTLKKYYEDHRELFEGVAHWQENWQLFVELDKKANDPTRLNNRGGNLLKEQKQRADVQKFLSKLEKTLKAQVDAWQQEQGREFLVNGQQFIEYVQMQWSNLQMEKELEKQERQQKKLKQKEVDMRFGTTILTPAKRRLATTPSKASSTPAKMRRIASSTTLATPNSTFSSASSKMTIHKPPMSSSQGERSHGKPPRALERNKDLTRTPLGALRNDGTSNGTFSSNSLAGSYSEFARELSKAAQSNMKTGQLLNSTVSRH